MEGQRFEGRAAIVTGAASGMGRATAMRLASEGAQVLAIDMNGEGLAETAAAHDGIVAMESSVADRDACFAAVARAVTEFGKLDILANIAGVLRFAHSHEQSEADWRLVLDVNLSGTFFMCQAALPHLIETAGSIVNISSNAGQMGQPYTAAYVSSKWAVIGLSKSLAVEYVKKGVRVNVVAPGQTDTNMNIGIAFPDDIDWDLMMPMTPKREQATPADIASTIAFLCSDEARPIHGAVVPVDNGVTAS